MYWLVCSVGAGGAEVNQQGASVLGAAKTPTSPRICHLAPSLIYNSTFKQRLL